MDTKSSAYNGNTDATRTNSWYGLPYTNKKAVSKFFPYLFGNHILIKNRAQMEKNKQFSFPKKLFLQVVKILTADFICEQ